MNNSRLYNFALLMTCVWACFACGKSQELSAATCPAIEMTAIAPARSDSTRQVTLNDSTIPLARTPVVTTADLTDAHASKDGDKWVVNFDLTDAAAKRVQDFSAQHVGQTIALLVDGKVMSTPRITGRLTGKGFKVGTFTQPEAERLAAAISSGCRH